VEGTGEWSPTGLEIRGHYGVGFDSSVFLLKLKLRHCSECVDKNGEPTALVATLDGFDWCFRCFLQATSTARAPDSKSGGEGSIPSACAGELPELVMGRLATPMSTER
jgi:hypothetical protein